MGLMACIFTTVGCQEEEAPSFAADIQPLLDESCLCHMENSDGVMFAETLTLNAGVAFGELVGTASTQAPDMLRVAPGDPEASYMWRKLQGTHIDAGGSGTAMPPIGPLSSEKLDTIETWIIEGATP